mgnify:CR=1 FL=1
MRKRQVKKTVADERETGVREGKRKPKRTGYTERGRRRESERLARWRERQQ